MPDIRPMDEVARLLGVGRRTLQQWLYSGRITGYRVAGDRRRYLDVDEVKRLREPEALPPRDDRSSA